MTTRSNLSLVDFLPVYQGIDTSINDPLYSYYPDTNFYEQVYLKKEFNDLKLSAAEKAKKPKVEDPQ